MNTSYRPVMTNSGLNPTHETIAIDEYQNHREMKIADERPLTLFVDDYELVTLMTLGCHPELLTLGYLKNQGLIDNIKDINAVQVDWDADVAAVTTSIEDHNWENKLRTRTVTTGCGQGTVFGSMMRKFNETQIQSVKLRQSDIYTLLKNLNAYNDVYKSAGAVHGCALCQGTEIISFMEDVGRHNAVDAIAGQMWLEGIDGNDKLFYTTGRLTSEMIIKVALMGVPTLLSRSGITRMGLKLARMTNVTLFSRAKGKHFLIYNGAENVEFDTQLPTKLSVANVKTSV